MLPRKRWYVERVYTPTTADGWAWVAREGFWGVGKAFETWREAFDYAHRRAVSLPWSSGAQLHPTCVSLGLGVWACGVDCQRYQGPKVPHPWLTDTYSNDFADVTVTKRRTPWAVLNDLWSRCV